MASLAANTALCPPTVQGGDIQPAASQARWRVSLELFADALRVTDPIPMLASQFQGIPELAEHQSALYTVLSELYSNALEHGVLRLASVCKTDAAGFERYVSEREQQLALLTEGSVALSITYTRTRTGGEVLIAVEDSGPGFDWRATGPLDTEDPRGQGLRIVRGFCRSVTFEGRGNRVLASYIWQRDGD